MPLDVAADDAPAKFPNPNYLTLGNFKRGVITLVNPSKVPQNALCAADDVFLVEDGQPSPRPGVAWYGTSPVLPVPGATVTLTLASGTTLGIGVYHYRITFVNAQGETTASTYVAITTTTSNQKVNLTTIPIGAGGVTARKIYRTAVGGTTGSEKLVTTIADNTTTTYSDTVADGSLGVAIPSTNTATSGEIDGYDYFDYSGVTHLVCCADGNVWRSVNDGLVWTLCTGYTMTAGNEVWMEQYNSGLYITNGVDIIVIYNGTTSLVTYTSLSTPSAPTIAATGTEMTGGTGYTYYYKISAVSQIGFSIASTAASIAVGIPRSEWTYAESSTTTNNYLTITIPNPVTTQTRFDLYISVDDLNFYYLDSVSTSTASPTLTYQDAGTAIEIPSTIAPTTNTSQGPLVQQVVTVSTRLYGVRDQANKQRIWFTSGSYPLGSFSDGYDGGYLDWQLGGKYTTTMVADYRDGKGDSVATVWMDSPDGQGCIIQMTLGTLTVGNLSVTVPSAYRLPGSRGTPAPGSVVNVLNDYMFYNTQAFYNLGNRPQLLEILSTDEASANIRPTVRTITASAASGIASMYYDAKVYFSVPYNNTTNNYTAIFDTELEAWLPTAYTIGFKKFLRYTDTNQIHHLLGLKPGDNQLSELGTLYSQSQYIQGDYGEPLNTNLLTGVYSLEKDRYDFQYVQEMEYEVSNPSGIINFELLGYDHAEGFTSENTAILDVTNSTVGTTGWDTFGWDLNPWDDTSLVPVVASEDTTKRYSVVGAEMNTGQWHIFTSSLDAGYVLRMLQLWGTDTEDAHPSGWQIVGTNG